MSGALNNVFIRGRGVVVDLDFEARLLEKVREDVTAEIAVDYAGIGLRRRLV